MSIRRLSFVFALAGVLVASSASAQMGAVAVPAQAGGSLPPGMRVMFQRPAVTFRWSDGDWVVRVGVTVTNMVGMPVTLHPRQFDCWANGRPMTYWAPAATLQGPQTIMPGQTVAGTLAWYYNRAMPMPMAALVTSGGMGGMYRDNLPVVPGAGGAAVAVPVAPVAPIVPVAPAVGPVTPGVNFVFQPVGQAFRWSDQDWVARITVTIVNGTPMPVQIVPSMFDAFANGMAMTDWSSAASMRAPVMLMPGQSTSGTLAWYYTRTMPQPQALMVTYRGAPWVRGTIMTPLAPMGHIPGAVR